MEVKPLLTAAVVNPSAYSRQYYWLKIYQLVTSAIYSILPQTLKHGGHIVQGDGDVHVKLGNEEVTCPGSFCPLLHPSILVPLYPLET